MATILITGGHSGIGIQCCKVLAATYKYNLVLAGRSPEQMESFAQELRTEYAIKVDAVEMDTSSLNSVRLGAVRCLDMLENGEIDSLHAIICNAGVRLNGNPTYSQDGYEETFATNYLGHALLTQLLSDRLVNKGRIVFTASGTHDPDTADGKMMGVAEDLDAVKLANAGKDGLAPISSGKRYATSKLLMIQYAYELNRKLRKSGSTISSIAFDPGATSGTGFLRNMPAPVRWLAGSAFMKWVMKKSGVTMGDIKFSGECLAVVAADAKYANGSGKYFQTNDGKLLEQRSSKASYDKLRSAKLWEDTQDLIDSALPKK